MAVDPADRQLSANERPAKPGVIDDAKARVDRSVENVKQHPGRFTRRLFAPRNLIAAAVVGLIAAVALSLIWDPFAYLAIAVFGLWLLALAADPERVLSCPYCKKRVKAGAKACHHCGRIVVPQGEPGLDV